MEEEGTLYCYRLDEVTGEVHSFEIDPSEWQLRKHIWNSGRDEYVFWKNLGTNANYNYSVQRRKLDRYISSKVYTFNPDPSHAYDVISKELNAKLKKAKLDVKKYNKMLKMLEANKQSVFRRNK